MALSISDFYKLMPSGYHEPGDIWKSIPVRGFNRITLSDAIVITPSCDLANRKSEVINLIPIIPVDDLFFEKAFYFEITNSMQGVLSDLGGIAGGSRFSLPSVEDVLAAGEIIKFRKEEDRLRYESFISYIRFARGDITDKPEVAKILGQKKYNSILESIISNSYRPDMHFFPASSFNSSFAINKHSVAMFRYILTIETEILDQIESVAPDDWEVCLKQADGSKIKRSGFTEYPVRICRLRDDFLTDLLSRHLNMHLRFGSRDFNDLEIKKIKGEVCI